MLEGSCHCGNVKWNYPLTLESVTACNCTLCRSYGALWVYGYIEEGITIFGSTNFYERGSKINKYNFCSLCGCITHYLANKVDKQNRRRVAINVRTTSQPEKIMNLPIDRFEGLVSFEDLPRDGKTVKDLWF
jgi:hypothetical protein